MAALPVCFFQGIVYGYCGAICPGDGNGKAWISLLHLAEYVLECPITCSIFSSHETLLITISSCCDSICSGCSPAALA
ncbi:hypothetical protein Peur_046073 [Populus x canadensis]